MDRGTWRATAYRVERLRHDLVSKPPLPLRGRRGRKKVQPSLIAPYLNNLLNHLYRVGLETDWPVDSIIYLFINLGITDLETDLQSWHMRRQLHVLKRACQTCGQTSFLLWPQVSPLIFLHLSLLLSQMSDLWDNHAYQWDWQRPYHKVSPGVTGRVPALLLSLELVWPIRRNLSQFSKETSLFWGRRGKLKNLLCYFKALPFGTVRTLSERRHWLFIL